MTKYLFLLLGIIALGTSVHSQTLSPAQVKQVMKQADSLLSAYERAGTLLESGKLKISEGAVANYKAIFKDTMTQVYGDLLNEHNIVMIKEGKSPKLGTIPLFEYINKTSMKFRHGIKVKVVNKDVDLAGMKNNTLQLLVEQRISGIKGKGLEVTNQDTVRMTIEFRPGFTAPRIASISPTGLGGYLQVDDADKKDIEAMKPASKKKK